MGDGEECDDGNIRPGDGCSDACVWEPWQHVGVAHDVPIADLHGWTQCWADDYGGEQAFLVSSLPEACDKANLLVACKLNSSDALALAAHAPREDVLFPVNYSLGERHEANGVAWYWSPDHDHVGFGPANNVTPCIVLGEDEQVCWRTQTVDSVTTFTFGRRCGAKLGFTNDEAPDWQRLVFQR